MKGGFVLFLILSFPLKGFCDFADYWIVVVNDSTVYDSRKDRSSWKGAYQLDLASLKLGSKDVLTITYRSDTPCPDCEYNLLFTDHSKNKKKLIKNIGSSNFELTYKDIMDLDSSTSTELIYFKSDEGYLRKIIEIVDTSKKTNKQQKGKPAKQ